MTKATNEDGKERCLSAKPYTMLGAGQIASSVWKTRRAADDYAYRFNVFRMCDESGDVGHIFLPSDIEHLARLAQLLAFEISDDGCLDREFRDDLSCLAACLDDVLPSGRPVPERLKLRRHVGDALREIVDYLIYEEGQHFRQNRSPRHIYRSVVLAACWLDGHLCDDERLNAVSDLGSVDYFGGCPICAQNDGFLTVHRVPWFVCHKHHVRWWMDDNDSSCAKQLASEDGQANWDQISSYREVEPLLPGLPQDVNVTS